MGGQNLWEVKIYILKADLESWQKRINAKYIFFLNILIETLPKRGISLIFELTFNFDF